MAVDINEVIDNLYKFYKFDNKVIISVGSGGGQFIEYGRNSKHVIAIDNDQEALTSLEKALQKKQLINKFTLIHSDFYEVKIKGDVVFFEFCLHEMSDTELAINHALTMAPCILISDHWPESEWAYIVDEKEKVIHSWLRLKKFAFTKVQRFDTYQFFKNYQELFSKVKVQGEKSIDRIKQYKSRTNFKIPMSYGFVQIEP